MHYMNDIYFLDEYARVSEIIEPGKSERFDFRNALGHIRHLFIKREIEHKVDGHTYYDVITPYGYGGPIVVDCEPGRQEQLIHDFHSAFSDFCNQEHIVSEFVRFHPIAGNGPIFQSIYEPVLIKNTYATNLRDYDHPEVSEFSKSCRKSIRQAIKKGVTCRITEQPASIDEFLKIYYSTMKRDDALSFYYFPKEYFDALLSNLRENILYVEALYEGKAIAAGLYFISAQMIHAHLSGTLTEYLSLSPAYVLKHETTLWGKMNGYHFFHHGGGTTNSPEDPLAVFKQKFSQNTAFPFYISKKIWNPEIYTALCKFLKADENTGFFPAYRKRR